MRTAAQREAVSRLGRAGCLLKYGRYCDEQAGPLLPSRTAVKDMENIEGIEHQFSLGLGYRLAKAGGHVSNDDLQHGT